MNIRRAIHSYYAPGLNHQHRYRSWEHCYAYFRENNPQGLAANPDEAALQLGFYLASWGMYRGSSFLLQYTYTVHRPAIAVLAEERFTPLLDMDCESPTVVRVIVPLICELIGALRQAYKPFVLDAKSTQPTDTLISKIILGTFACLPACDRYFISGFKHEGLQYSGLNSGFVTEIHEYCRAHLKDLQREQSRLQSRGELRYPLMKLVDTCFWQTGYELDNA